MGVTTQTKPPTHWRAYPEALHCGICSPFSLTLTARTQNQQVQPNQVPSCSSAPGSRSGRSAPSPSGSRRPRRPRSVGKGRRPRGRRPADRQQRTELRTASCVGGHYGISKKNGTLSFTKSRWDAIGANEWAILWYFKILSLSHMQSRVNPWPQFNNSYLLWIVLYQCISH